MKTFHILALSMLSLSSFHTATAMAASPLRSIVSVDAVLSGPATYYQSPQLLAPEVHIIGVYEAEGTARVHITGSTSNSVDLVLSSYNSVNWVLDGPGLPYVSQIVVNAYDASSVSGIDTAKVLNRSGYPNWLGTYGYAWPGAFGGSSTSLLVDNVAALFGVPISTFSGAYSANEFTVHLVNVAEPSTILLLLVMSPILLTRRRSVPHNRV